MSSSKGEGVFPGEFNALKAEKSGPTLAAAAPPPRPVSCGPTQVAQGRMYRMDSDVEPPKELLGLMPQENTLDSNK